MYASHVLDGLRVWATHLAFLSPGGFRCFGPIDEIEALKTIRPAAGVSPLHQLCETWMEEDRLNARR